MPAPARAAGVLAFGLAAFALAAAPEPAAAQEPRSALFIVLPAEGDDDADAIIEPILLVHEDYYEDPVAELTDASIAEFGARWFPVGGHYAVLSRGTSAGTATVVGLAEPGCYGVGGRVRLAPARQEGRHALAGQGLPEQPGAPWLRDATRDERRVLDRLAAALFAAHGIDAAARTAGDTSLAAVLFHRNARPVLVGTYALATEDEVMRQAAAFIIAEEGQDGYRPAYVAFHDGRNPDLEKRELMDALDLDGDSSPELVLRNAFWESWDYSVLKRDEHGWAQVYRGGGAGC